MVVPDGLMQMFFRTLDGPCRWFFICFLL